MLSLQAAGSWPGPALPPTAIAVGETSRRVPNRINTTEAMVMTS